jgi:hypothetical protein
MDAKTMQISTLSPFDSKLLLANKWPLGKWCLNDKGYPRFYSGPFKNKYVHRVVAEFKLGRKLRKDEDIHHRDANKCNFRRSNLRVLGHAEHSWLTAKQHWFMKHKEEQEKREWNSFYDTTTKTKEDEQFADTSFEVSSFSAE